MDSPPFRLKPVIPFYLTDKPLSLGIFTKACNKKEKDFLYMQIQNSNRNRQVINFDRPNRYFPKSSAGANMDGEIEVEGYNEGGPIRTSLATSHAQSLYTQYLIIDFNNLNWLSK